MKRWIYFLGHLVILVILTSFVSLGRHSEKSEIPEALKANSNTLYCVNNVAIKTQSDTIFSIFVGKSFVGFKEALGFKESRGDYTSVNTFGYLGKYQFGKNTLKLMGVNDTASFLENPILQEQVFQLNVARNKWILRRYIKHYIGKRLNGVLITESGLVAAAHLAGAGNVKKYLRSNGKTNFSDAYGTTIVQYIKRFNGYETSDIKPLKNPKV